MPTIELIAEVKWLNDKVAELQVENARLKNEVAKTPVLTGHIHEMTNDTAWAIFGESFEIEFEREWLKEPLLGQFIEIYAVTRKWTKEEIETAKLSAKELYEWFNEPEAV